MVERKLGVSCACGQHVMLNGLATERMIDAEGIFVEVSLDVFWSDAMEGRVQPAPRFAILIKDQRRSLMMDWGGNRVKLGIWLYILADECGNAPGAYMIRSNDLVGGNMLEFELQRGVMRVDPSGDDDGRFQQGCIVGGVERVCIILHDGLDCAAQRVGLLCLGQRLPNAVQHEPGGLIADLNDGLQLDGGGADIRAGDKANSYRPLMQRSAAALHNCSGLQCCLVPA